MLDDMSCGWKPEAKPHMITPPKKARQRPALPSRSRSFRKASPHKTEYQPEEEEEEPGGVKEEGEVKEEEEEGEVSQAHGAVVVDLQAWQAKGLVDAMHRDDTAWASDSLAVGAMLLAVLFLWPVVLMAWVEPLGALTLSLSQSHPHP